MEKIGSIVKNVSGDLAGRMAFAELTGVKLGEALVSRGLAAFLQGVLPGCYYLLAQRHRVRFTHPVF